MHLKSLFRPMFAFKSTIFCHFAGYASVALETIWLHGPRELFFFWDRSWRNSLIKGLYSTERHYAGHG